MYMLPDQSLAQGTVLTGGCLFFCLRSRKSSEVVSVADKEAWDDWRLEARASGEMDYRGDEDAFAVSLTRPPKP